MIKPTGETSNSQNLKLVTKKKGKSYTETLIPVRFVPFTRDEDN